MKRFLVIGLAAISLVIAGFFLLVPAIVDRAFNGTVATRPARRVTPDALHLHQTLRIVDLHADPLLWGRDLLKRSSTGDVDVPRMIQGNVTLQIFTAVTKSPRGLNYERNEADSDTIIWLALAQRWPPRTWNSLTERALYLAERFNGMAAGSEGKLVAIRTSGDLIRYLKRRENEPGITAGMLGIEGGHALEGKLMNLDRVSDAGFRYISPTHFFDDEFAGSSAGVKKGGLTPLGRQLVERMNERRIIIDLAHSSSETIHEVLAVSRRPVIVSHGGLKGNCNNQRNLSDEEALGVARSGGIIGIGFWETTVCGNNTSAITKAMRYAVNLVGIEHVALGSDFDGAVITPFDAAHLAELTEAMLQDGFKPDEIRAIMGENALRFLEQNLPD
jgi:membrane dipeptidase